MMRMTCVAVAMLAACGSDGSNTGDDGPPSDGAAGGDAGGEQPPAGYTKLISRSWALGAGATDTYKCVRVTIPEDTYVTNIRAQAPSGTHHTVLTIAGANGTSGPDGEFDCGVGSLGMVMLYASGVGTSPLDFPTDVGVKIPAGTQLALNLHLYNATDNDLSGETGIWVKSQPTAPPTLAEMVFAGTTNIFIQSSSTPKDVSGGCTVGQGQDYKLFAIWPHMHQIATHQKVELVHNGTTTILHDQPFHFTEQNYYRQDPEISVVGGDQVKVTCTYLNDTGHLVTIGDSSNQEMCFSGFYRYPARNAGLFECSTGPGL